MILLSVFEYNITYQWQNMSNKLSTASRRQWKGF